MANGGFKPQAQISCVDAVARLLVQLLALLRLRNITCCATDFALLNPAKWLAEKCRTASAIRKYRQLSALFHETLLRPRR